MEVVENLEEWSETFQSGWLSHFQETGEINWKLYERPRNKESIPGESIDLSQSRLILISSAGAYLAGEQEPFDAENDLGDYSIRVFPSDTPFSALAYAHTHYDHAAVDADPQVLLPLRHLENLVEEGVIGELATSVISYGGYQPDAGRTLTETIPQILDVVDKEGAHAALLVPAWPLCVQSVGLIARALELAGVATTTTSWNPGVTRLVNPPRSTVTKLNRGATLGEPGDLAQQRRVLAATLALLAQDAPVDLVRLDEAPAEEGNSWQRMLERIKRIWASQSASKSAVTSKSRQK